MGEAGVGMLIIRFVIWSNSG